MPPESPAQNSVTLDPADPAFFANPYPAYSSLYDRSPFYWKNYGFWCVCGFDAVNEVLRDRRFGRQILHKHSRESLGLPEPAPHLADFHAVEAHSLLNQEPPNHTRLRKLVTSAFVSRNVERMQSSIESAANALLDSIATRFGESCNGCMPEFDLLEHYATPFPARIIADLTGVPHRHIPELLEWSHRMVKVYTLTQTCQEEIEANTAAMEFGKLITDLIEERRQQPKNDLLSTLVQVGRDTNSTGTAQVGFTDGNSQTQRPAPLTNDEIVSTIVLLLNAGHEATVHQIGNAVQAIVNSPIQASELFCSEEQSHKTVQELMRVDTPLHLFTRYALEDVTLPLSMKQKPFSMGGKDGAGLKIRTGEQIGLMLGAANHDPQRFDNPSTFDPFRSDAGHISLGAGIHYCLGASLAQMELSIALRVLFERFPDCRLAATPAYRNSYHFRGLEQLRMTLE